MHFVYAKVPLRGRGREPLDVLHHALEQALDAAGAGALVGWGTSLPAAGSADDDPRAFHRIDIELHDLDVGLRLLRETLLRLQAAPGAELHFTVDGAALQESLGADGWGPRGPSTGTHRPRRGTGAP